MRACADEAEGAIELEARLNASDACRTDFAEAFDPELLQVPSMDDGRGNAIARFLRALNDPDFDRTEPAEVPNGLAVGGSPDH